MLGWIKRLHKTSKALYSENVAYEALGRVTAGTLAPEADEVIALAMEAQRLQVR